MTNSIFRIGSLNSKDFCSLARSSFYLSRSGEFENLLKILYTGVGAQALNNAPHRFWGIELNFVRINGLLQRFSKTSQTNHLF